MPPVIKSPDPGGDVPIRLTEPQFSLPDAAFLSGVPHRSIRNWMARDVIEMGQRHFTGRWQFSMLDVVKLTVMHDLAVRMGFNPKLAATVADAAADIVMKSSARDASGELLDLKADFQPNRNIVINYTDDDKPMMLVADSANPGSYYPPGRGDPTTAPLRRSIVVVPVTAIFHDAMLRTQELARRNTKAEAPTHD